MKKLILALGLFLTIISCQKKSKSNYPAYYRMYNQVVKLENAYEIKEALKLFQEAEELVDFVPVLHWLKKRDLAILAKDCDLALDYFQKAVDNGYEFELADFSSEICPQISNASLKKGIGFDMDYKKAVEEIFEADQTIRMNQNTGDMGAVDAANIERLLTLISEKGYPDSKIVGSETADNAFIVLLHFDADIGCKRLSPIIHKAYHEGKLSPPYYAWIIDRRRHWGPDKLDPYFYQIPSERYFELTKEEIAEVDARRNSIGLIPLSELGIERNENGRIVVPLGL